jgi:hypothetical protein
MRSVGPASEVYNSQNFDAVGVRPRNDLLVSRDHAVHQSVMRCLRHFGVAGQHAEIVDSLQDNEVTHAGLSQHVMIEAR